LCDFDVTYVAAPCWHVAIVCTKWSGLSAKINFSKMPTVILKIGILLFITEIWLGSGDSWFVDTNLLNLLHSMSVGSVSVRSMVVHWVAVGLHDVGHA
jgi:hypothetical protein